MSLPGSSNNTDFKINLKKSKTDASKYITCSIIVNSWRHKREEVKSLAESLALQTSKVKQLQQQTIVLKRILQSDRRKLPTAMAEVTAMRQEVTGSVKENALLENKRLRDVQASSHASGLQALWRSCKVDLTAARADAADAHRMLLAEKAKLRLARDRNSEILQKMEECDDHLNKSLIKLKEAKQEIEDLKKIITRKDEHIEKIESDLENSKELIKQQTEKAENEMNKLMTQLEVANEKINKWPFRGIVTWSGSVAQLSTVDVVTCASCWWNNRYTSVIQGLLNIMLSIIS